MKIAPRAIVVALAALYFLIDAALQAEWVIATGLSIVFVYVLYLGLKEKRDDSVV